jgi:hypothetical protein
MKAPLFLCSAALLLLLSACASPEGAQKRQQALTDWSRGREEVRAVRQRETDARDDMRWNRAMGRPLDDPGTARFGEAPGAPY